MNQATEFFAIEESEVGLPLGGVHELVGHIVADALETLGTGTVEQDDDICERKRPCTNW
jgi:hypothetical protein